MGVIYSGRPLKFRTAYRIAGISPNVTFGVHNNSVQNLRRGLAERVFNVETQEGLAPPPRPIPGAYHRLEEIRGKIVDQMPWAAPLTVQEFLDSYQGDRRYKVYAEAADSLEHDPVKRSDAFLTTFVKAEKINFSSKPDPAPRVIQPRTPRYNLSVGLYLKRMEKEVYKAIANVYGGDPVVMKGYNAHRTAEVMRAGWESFDNPVAVGLDASRFDQHVSAEALRWEHSVYLSRYSGIHKSTLRKLLEWQVDNKGVGRATDGVVKYRVEGCRMSGDMNTALGNCLLMCALVWTYCKDRGIKHKLYNNGDDCVVIMESRDLGCFQRGLAEWFVEMGFTMKVESPVRVFEQIEFCQTHPVFDGAKWVMCRDPRVCLSKDTVSLLPMLQGNTRYAWATAIGQCGMSLAGGIPVMQEFYSCLLRVGGGKVMGKHPALESGFARLAVGMHRRYSTVCEACRVSFWEAFGILPSEQMEYERLLSSITPDLKSPHQGNTLYDQTFSLGAL
nr:MAG: RNA-dependent RNA polymerase [Chemarfal virus 166]